ncbi:MAG TPA: hypothetical protein VJ696_06900, partial [Rhodanobacteraceae bacterium]|nr:hypothetical protein [Rhodanobacteraceae bacterium]
MKRRWVSLGFVLGISLAAHAGVIDRAQDGAYAGGHATWSAWGGDIGIRWNRDLLGNLGVTVGDAPAGKLALQDFRLHEFFNLRQSGGLQFTVFNGALRKFNGGSLQMRGGFVLALRDGSRIDLRDLTLRARGDGSNIIDLVSNDGRSWLYSDSVMFRLGDGKRSLEIKSANLRMSKAFANRIGVPDAAGWNLGDIAMSTEVFVQGADLAPERVCDPYPWPNVAVPQVPGAVYQGDLFMEATNYDPVGCQGCDGPGGADGLASIAPNSTLRNNVNDGTIQATINGDPLGTSDALYTGNIAWHEMFSGINDPYGNDQHPFLIWNMYRLDADGTIRQIGRSGVKHAFLTINDGCLDGCNNFDSLGRGCGDTYGSGNNDSPFDMGPRSEIVPAEGIWGRCGSIWDPDCTGTSHSNGNTSWTQRMKVPESQLDPAAHAGATFMMESWYVARDDIDVYNSMATITGTPHYSGSTWSLSQQANFRLGPAIDRWVDPANPGANAKSSEIAVPEGHAKVAIKVTALGNNHWRYDYAVMNLDFSRAVVEAPQAGPDPRVVSNRGFDSFSVPVPAGVAVISAGAYVGDPNPNANWRTRVADGRVTWSTDTSISAPGGSGNPPVETLPTLDWGSMYTFSFTADTAPANGNATLHVAEAGSPASYDAASLV